jgi:hypothetical protein
MSYIEKLGIGTALGGPCTYIYTKDSVVVTFQLVIF